MKPAYDSRPSVPAATPKSDAVRLRMLDTTCGDEGLVTGYGRDNVHVASVSGSVWAYLGVVLDAGSDNRVDGELPLFVQG